MHPIYEYMAGDTVSYSGRVTNKLFKVKSQIKFVIKECRKVFVGSKSVNNIDVWENHYIGLSGGLKSALFDEDELHTCRMVLIEKNVLGN